MEVMVAVFITLVAGMGLAVLVFITLTPLPLQPEGVVRVGYWPGLKPDINKQRVMCSTCAHHSAAMAGWTYDRCKHPKADLGSVVRNDQLPTCWEMRLSADQCGPTGAWHTPIEGK